MPPDISVAVTSGRKGEGLEGGAREALASAVHSVGCPGGSSGRCVHFVKIYQVAYTYDQCTSACILHIHIPLNRNSTAGNYPADMHTYVQSNTFKDAH